MRDEMTADMGEVLDDWDQSFKFGSVSFKGLLVREEAGPTQHTGVRKEQSGFALIVNVDDLPGGLPEKGDVITESGGKSWRVIEDPIQLFGVPHVTLRLGRTI